MQIITTAVLKGGTGKTVTVTALAQAGVMAGKRVLAIDLDAQANLTFALAADPNQPGALQLFQGTPAKQLIQQTAQGISVIAGHRDLSTVKTTPGSANRLRNALDPIKNDYDLCVIDTPPQFGEMVYNALNAATDLIIPLEADIYSVQGLYQITELAHQIQQSNTELKNMGVIITNYDDRPKLNKYLRDVIEEKGAAAGAPLLMAIRSGVSIREAVAFQQSLFEYAPKSKPAQDYAQLYKMITKTK